MAAASHTTFERPRGVNAVRLRDGVAHLRVSGLPREAVMAGRLAALERLRDASVLLDFLKLTPDGFTFVVEEAGAQTALDTLRGAGLEANLAPGRAVLSVHCVNIRDEAGIVAKIAETATGSGARIEQVGDSHDCILLVVEGEQAARAAAALRDAFGLEATGAD